MIVFDIVSKCIANKSECVMQDTIWFKPRILLCPEGKKMCTKCKDFDDIFQKLIIMRVIESFCKSQALWFNL